MTRGSWPARIASGLLVSLAFVFLAYTAAANWRDLEAFEWRVEVPLLALSIVAHVGVLAFGVWIWSLVLGRLAADPPPYPRLLSIWALSNAARYIPGAVWQFLTAAQLARGAGLPAVTALTAMLIHVGLSLLAAVIVAAFTLPLPALIGIGEGSAQALALGLPLVGLVLVHPAVLNAALRLIPRALHREVLAWNGSWVRGAGLLALSVFSWCLYGVAFTLFVRSLAPVPATAIVPLTGVTALSFVAGYVVVVAPGGLGVREGAMTLLLAPLLPAGVAAVVAVAARLWSIAAEVGLAALGLLATRALRRSPPDPAL